MHQIEKNVREVRERIAEAAARSGRDASAVTLIGVTKTAEIDAMRAMIGCGVNDIGENRAQEIVRKFPEINRPGVNWHMIGSLQKNKVKYIAGMTRLIQSVDSYGLAVEIGRVSNKNGARADILIEVNIAGEDTKGGVTPKDCPALVKSCAELQGVRVRGLMTMAPFISDADKIRGYFRKMRELYVDIREKCGNIGIIDTLSMGMTNDYTIAVEEGATMVRIGTAIFGSRT